MPELRSSDQPTSVQSPLAFPQIQNLPPTLPPPPAQPMHMAPSSRVLLRRVTRTASPVTLHGLVTPTLPMHVAPSSRDRSGAYSTAWSVALHVWRRRLRRCRLCRHHRLRRRRRRRRRHRSDRRRRRRRRLRRRKRLRRRHQLRRRLRCLRRLCRYTGPRRHEYRFGV